MYRRPTIFSQYRASTVNCLSTLADMVSTNAEAMTSFRGSPSTATTEYSRSGFTAANWLLGSVQGVVVQTSRSASRQALTLALSRRESGTTSGNRT